MDLTKLAQKHHWDKGRKDMYYRKVTLSNQTHLIRHCFILASALKFSFNDIWTKPFLIIYSIVIPFCVLILFICSLEHIDVNFEIFMYGKEKKNTCVLSLFVTSHLTGQFKSTGGYYNALVSAFFRTGAGEIAVSTVSIMFVWAWFKLISDNTRRTDHLCFGNFTHESPKVGILAFSWDLFCLHSTKQYRKTCLPYRYRFSIVLKYFYSWFSSTTYWCSFWSINTTYQWLRQLFRYSCLCCAGYPAHSRNQSYHFRERVLYCFW